MKHCPRHLADLTRTLKRKGMWRLVSLNNQDIRRRTHLWLTARATREDIDPFVISTLEIYAKAREICGNYLFGKNAIGNEYCPLCELQIHVKSQRDIDQVWIDNCTDAVLIVCKANYLA